MNIKEMLRQSLPNEIYEMCVEIEKMQKDKKTNEDICNAYQICRNQEEDEESNAFKYLDQKRIDANDKVNESKYEISQAKLKLEIHPENKWWGCGDES
jgi:hypothetical protein